MKNNMKSLGSVTGRSYNLHTIRFIAAIMVVISHSFSISQGEAGKEIISEITKGQISLGGIAVSVFFLTGGYLIAKSMERLKTYKSYFLARCIRIFPLLIVVVLITMLVIGPLVTVLPLNQYFKDSMFYRYALNGILLLQHSLPGVFDFNAYGNVVNGSLWTLPVEFLCYIACFVMYKCNLLKEKTAIYTIPIVVLGYIGLKIILIKLEMTILVSALMPCMLFYIGMLYFVYRDKIVLNKITAIIAGICLVVCFICGRIAMGIFVFFPYACLYLSFGATQKMKRFSKMGDYSYGIYLCGFPIQQLIVHYMGLSMNPMLNIILAVPTTIICAVILFHCVEEPVNKFYMRLVANQQPNCT